MTAPKRKIIQSCLPVRPVNGRRYTCVLECGHCESVKLRDIKDGATWCFDCYYNKPPMYDTQQMQDIYDTN